MAAPACQITIVVGKTARMDDVDHVGRVEHFVHGEPIVVITIADLENVVDAQQMALTVRWILIVVKENVNQGLARLAVELLAPSVLMVLIVVIIIVCLVVVVDVQQMALHVHLQMIAVTKTVVMVNVVDARERVNIVNLQVIVVEIVVILINVEAVVEKVKLVLYIPIVVVKIVNMVRVLDAELLGMFVH
jgi:hypothetical protein